MIEPSHELHPSDEELRQYLSSPSALPPGRAEQITEHLETCLHCNEVLKKENPTPDLLREWPEVGSEDSAASKSMKQADFLPETQDHRDPRQSELPLPDIPGYEVLGVLGRGGMGVVYQARHLALKRLVALKMIGSGSHPGPQVLARFRAEAEAVARLQHPNIVQIFAVGEHGGLPYCSLEFVSGGSLSRKLAGNPQNPRAAAELVRTLAGAVHYAHVNGVIHRDLKPANVLLSVVSGTPSVGANDNRAHSERTMDEWQLTIPKISDFGLAKQLDSSAGQTQSGIILGTPSYMAPEQAAGKSREIGPAADIYALGAILYEMLTGRPPFKAETPWDTVVQVIEQDVVPPARLQPKVPRDLETICLKCLAKEPQRRYASAAELRADLDRFLQGTPIQAGPLPRGTTWNGSRYQRAIAIISCLVAIGAICILFFTLQMLTRAQRAAEQAGREAQREKEHADEQLRRAEAATYEIALKLAQQQLEAKNRVGARETLSQWLPHDDAHDLRDARWHQLWRQAEKKDK